MYNKPFTNIVHMASNQDSMISNFNTYKHSKNVIKNTTIWHNPYRKIASK